MDLQLRIKANKLGIQCYESFYKFFVTFWTEMSGEEYFDNWHIKLICDTLQEKAEKLFLGIDMLETVIINVPPGSSKSTIATIAFPMWVWLHKPSFATTNISYAAEVSKGHSNKARSILSSKRWSILFDDLFMHKHKKALKITKDAERQMTNNFGGERFNTSVGGTITGMHANIIIEDDPLNPKEAFSDAEREAANIFHDDTVSSRKKNFRSFLNIIIAQRIHEEDTCGHVLNQNIPITHICLPAELLPKTPVIPSHCSDSYVNGVLDPIRKPKFVLEAQAAVMSSVGYSGQFLQQPFNLEEQPIKPSYFEKIDERDDMVFDLYVDGAFTEKKENDPSGLTVLGFKNNMLYIKAVYNVYKSLPDLLAFIKELGESGVFSADKGRIFIEPKASGISLSQYIASETTFNYVLIGDDKAKGEKNIVSQGKTARHALIQPKAESRRIKLFKGGWNDDYIHQLCGFPRAAHDEQVDNTGYAVYYNFLKENSFIKNYALNKLEEAVFGGLNYDVILSQEGKKILSEAKETPSGDIILYEEPSRLHKYRYISILTIKNNDGRDESNITVYDRLKDTICAQANYDNLQPEKVAKKALALSVFYSNARLVVTVEKSGTNQDTEESDLSHLAIRALRAYNYNNMHIRLTINQISQSQEREYGFLLNTSTRREIFYNIKDFVEKNKLKEIPRNHFDQLSSLSKNKETGEINVQKGTSEAAIVSLAIAVKVSGEMSDKVVTKKRAGW